jgi:hypothetical protein
MTIETRVCVGCKSTEENERLERCVMCARDFCADCAHRAYARRFCSPDCARAFFFEGEEDTDEKDVQYE